MSFNTYRMSTTDEGSTDDKTEEVKVKVEADTQEPEESESTSAEEETSTNESSKPKSQDEKRSAGAVIAGLGNEKKAIAEKFVALARSSETARKQVQSDLKSDQALASYIKSKFGESYDEIMGSKPIKDVDEIDVDRIREEERTKAQRDALKEQMALRHEQILEAKAKELGFTTDEFEKFKTKVELLGGDDSAIEDAALIVNSTKARASKGEWQPAGEEAEAPKQKEVTITPGLKDFATSRDMNMQEFAKGVDKVKRLHRKDATGKSVMDLPGL